jgi:macrolide transport system ATP-binding/permease protein
MTGGRRPIAPVARRLLALAASRRHRDAILTDYDDETAGLAAVGGDREAARWARRQVIESIPPLLLDRLRVPAARIWRTYMGLWRGLKMDLALTIRRLLAAPGFTAVAVATLAVGIGGNMAIFTLIDRMLVETLPVPRPTELYRLGDTDACCVNSGLAGAYSLFSYDLYRHLRDSTPEFTNLAAFQAHARSVTIGRSDVHGPDETIYASFVSGNYFQTFELVPAAGRLLQPDDDRPGAPTTAVISYRAWNERFNRNPAVIGARISLNGFPAILIGVAPQTFYGETIRPDPPDLWIPLSNEPLLQPAAHLLTVKGSNWLYVVGRLRPDTALAPVNAKLTSSLQHWLADNLDWTAEERRELPRQHVALTSAATGVRAFTDSAAPGLKLLQGIAAAVLLIACANLANLLLARGMARRTETAVRVALGAPRARLLRQALIESVLLASAGGVAGIWIAYAGARTVIAIAMRGTALPVDPSPSPAVVLVACAVSLATGVLFGIAPAALASRTDPIEAMRGANRATVERGGRLRRGLVAVQIAVSLVLVSCAGLLARTLLNLQAQDFGFERTSRVIVDLAPSLQSIPRERLAAVYARMQERLLGVPGVTHAAFSLYSPMSGDNWSSLISVDGHGSDEQLNASWDRVSTGYFETIGTPLLRGRAFTQADTPDSAPVAVVSATFARKFFGDADPIGRHIGFGSTPSNRILQIVGVVGNATYQDGRSAQPPMFFLPFLQRSRAASTGSADNALDRSQYPNSLELVVSGTAQDIEAQVRQALAEVDRHITVERVMTLDEQIARQFTGDALMARLTAAFGVMALLLACLGLYGVTAYSVSRRTREIGIRMAIGANRGDVLKGIIRGALVQLAIGLAIGFPAAIAAAQLLRSQLFGIGAYDPVSFGGSLVLLGAAAILAALIPARRAATLDPVRALRVD